MGILIPSIASSLSIKDISKDLEFMRSYTDAAMEVTIWESNHVVYCLGDPDAMSFMDMIKKAAAIDPCIEIVPNKFSPHYQELCKVYPKIIDDKREYLVKRVDEFLGMVAKTQKSLVMDEVIYAWTTTPVKEIRDMWRNELRRRAIIIGETYEEYNEEVLSDTMEGDEEWSEGDEEDAMEYARQRL